MVEVESTHVQGGGSQVQTLMLLMVLTNILVPIMLTNILAIMGNVLMMLTEIVMTRML